MRRAQLQMGESMMVLVILMILGAIALVFYFNLAQEKNQLKVSEYEELDAVEVAQTASSLYELRCAKPGVVDLCFDKHKAKALSELRTSKPDLVRDYYHDMFRDAKVTLQVIYPEEDPSQPELNDYVLYENHAVQPNGDGTYNESSKKVIIPVPVHDSGDDTVAFGVLVVKRYHEVRGAMP